jgi:hypothetical protein
MAKSQRISKEERDVIATTQTRTLLHVGCGPKHPNIPECFKETGWKEVRFDIDPKVKPDILGSITDMKAVETGSVDALFSSHNIEHLEFHNVFVALGEFKRVLKDDGYVFLLCPDLQVVGELIAQDKLFATLYESPAGPIAPFDMLYGYRKYLPTNPFMAHRSGFTLNSMLKIFSEVGFGTTLGIRNPNSFELMVVGFKAKLDHDIARPRFAEIVNSRKQR